MDGSKSETLALVPPAALGRLMPMFLWVSVTGHVREAGPTLLKLCEGRPLLGCGFLDVFEITRPRPVASVTELEMLAGRRLHLRLRDAPDTAFRGLAVPLATGQGVIVNLSLGIGLAAAVSQHELTDADFAATDLAVELLYLQEAKSAVMEELHGMNLRLAHARTAAEEKARTDPLTGLANRRELDAALARAAAGAGNGGAPFALVHIDLDFFKAVNDSLGHAAGDEVLMRVSQILREETRKSDVVARVGGDEFVLILRSTTDPDGVQALSRRAIDRMEEPIQFEDQFCRISASVGVTVSSLYAAPDPDQMLLDADLALYASKRRGRACCTVFTPGMEVPEDRRAPG
ncbi:GGDEF domain-containing protein [Ostreiculturibacter nitratireducens]|uniref:GGDEF domain-containing protein n=1 Tax=Ostreiculturibacter nitratireducens TaxID=3075226 RepID=UPI0031B64A6E